MPITARDPGGGDFTPAPQGTHLARCVQVLDIGTQYSEFYDKSARKILIGWELPDEHWENGDGQRECHLVWHRYTLSLHKRAGLRADLEAWRGREFSKDELEGFDLSKLLNVPCMLSVVHTEQDGKTYANVKSVMALPRGTIVPDREHSLVIFDVNDADMAVFETFRDSLQETINKCSEWNQPEPSQVSTGTTAHAEPIATAVEADDIPF